MRDVALWNEYYFMGGKDVQTDDITCVHVLQTILIASSHVTFFERKC